jgi:hypothetical protein
MGDNLRFMTMGAMLIALVAGYAATGKLIERPPVQLCEFESENVILGDRPVGSVVDRNVVCRNHTDRPWKIRSVHATCSCVSIDEQVVGKTLGPNEEIRVPIQVDIGLATGFNTQMMSLQFEDEFGDRTSANCFVSFNGVPELAYSPVYLELDATGSGTAQGVINVMARGIPEVRIESMRSVNGNLALEVVDLSDPLNVQVKVSYDGSGTRGRQVSDTIYLHTNSEKMPYLSIPVTIHHRDRLDHWPSALVFSDEASTSQVEIYGVNASELELIELKLPNGIDLVNHSKVAYEGQQTKLRFEFRHVKSLPSSESKLEDVTLTFRRKGGKQHVFVSVPVFIFKKENFHEPE